MNTLVWGAGFMLAHMLLVVGFVPIANILPAAFGAMAMSAMALSLLLAARWRIVDHMTGGPDKSYVLHRYLGYFALFGALGHWALASSFGEGIVPFLTESGEDSGNIAAFGLLGMTAAALVRAIPYHIWKASHMLMGPIFLVAVYHTFFTATPLAVGSLPWLVLLLVSGLGIAGWIQTLSRKRSPTRLVTISRAKPMQDGIDITLESDKPIPRFVPGQFSTLAHNEAGAEAHPFTIAGGDDTHRRFVIRAAGDWTHDLVRHIKKGDHLRLGRAQGRFRPRSDKKRPPQLWVAGGVGITPFLATLEAMSPDDNAPATLIYSFKDQTSAGGLEDIKQHAARLPQLELVLLDTADGEPLSKPQANDIINKLPANTQAWLCGPEGLKEVVMNAWEEAGMRGRVHYERFDFRGAFSLTELLESGKSVYLKFLTVVQTQLRHKKDATSGS